MRTSKSFRMHDMEPNVIVLVDKDGHGAEFCNTLNSLGDQGQNADDILQALRAMPDPAHNFMNNLRILRSIDLCELQDVKIFPEFMTSSLGGAQWKAWEAFRDDPARAIMSWDDKKVAALWTIIRSRQG